MAGRPKKQPKTLEDLSPEEQIGQLKEKIKALEERIEANDKLNRAWGVRADELQRQITVREGQYLKLARAAQALDAQNMTLRKALKEVL